MKIKKRQLRKIIREALMTESAGDQVKALLDSAYDVESDDTKYPYGRNEVMLEGPRRMFEKMVSLSHLRISSYFKIVMLKLRKEAARWPHCPESTHLR